MDPVPFRTLDLAPVLLVAVLEAVVLLVVVLAAAGIQHPRAVAVHS